MRKKLDCLEPSPLQRVVDEKENKSVREELLALVENYIDKSPMCRGERL